MNTTSKNDCTRLKEILEFAKTDLEITLSDPNNPSYIDPIDRFYHFKNNNDEDAKRLKKKIGEKNWETVSHHYFDDNVKINAGDCAKKGYWEIKELRGLLVCYVTSEITDQKLLDYYNQAKTQLTSTGLYWGVIAIGIIEDLLFNDSVTKRHYYFIIDNTKN
jgi:hypothetical protein